MDVTTPLSVEEQGELDRFLSRCLGGMTPHEARGFLTAIVSGPSFIPPSEWLDMVVGHPGLQLEERFERAIGLLLRLYNQTSDDLAGHREIPAADLSPDDLKQWCAGYVKGSRLHDGWRADRAAVVMLVPMAVLSGGFDLHGETDSEGAVIEDDSHHRALYREKLPQFVAEIHEYWLRRRRPAARQGK
jgi:yecA family protein